VGLASYAYLGSFTRLLGDDFCSIGIASRLGLFRSIWFWYLNWSGRYTAFATDWLILKTSLGPYRLYYIVPITIFLWLIFATSALYLYLQNMSREAFLHSLALADIFLFLVLFLSPSIPQSLFWWNGMRSYALPLVVLTFYIFLFKLNVEYIKLKPAASYGLGFLLLFLSGGMGETMAVAQTAFIVFMIGLLVFKFLERPRTELNILYFSLAGAICSLIVVILAPGNALRQAQLPPSPDLATLVSVSIQAYGAFLVDLFREPAGAASLVGAILGVLWIGGYYKNLISVRLRLIPAYIFGGVLISFACFPPAVFGYSEPPPIRIIIIPLFFLMAGILCASFIAGIRLAGRFRSAWISSSTLLVSIALLCFSTVTAAQTLYNERDIYINFARKWDQVDAQILQAKANQLKSVNIPAMDNWAGVGRPTDNENYWPNQCYASHYGIQVFGPPYSD